MSERIVIGGNQPTTGSVFTTASGTISIPGLEEIAPLKKSVIADIMSGDRDLRDKINEIAEKVNILIRIKNGEVEREIRVTLPLPDNT
jgi:hypothetical protein